jgi:formylglycine-generating enzyme required for sulfatase activity
VRDLYQDAPDAGVHGAAEWLLRRWKQEGKLAEFEQQWAENEDKRDAKQEYIRKELARRADRGESYWWINGQGQTMVVVPGPATFRMGSPAGEAGRVGGPKGTDEAPHEVRIGRSFAIASREVTFRQFHRFRKDHEQNKTFSPTEHHPVTAVTWYDAAAYCNWLSEQEGIAPEQWCYEPNKQGKYAQGMKLKSNYLSLEGYRLPSEAEWEYACRAGARTSRYFGETEQLLGQYAWYAKVAKDRAMLPAGSLKPNDLGLFDMLGNAVEWCQERDEKYQPAAPWTDDREDVHEIDSTIRRSLRGGSFFYLAVDVRSAFRFRYVPSIRSYLVGFRPVRTFHPGAEEQ